MTNTAIKKKGHNVATALNDTKKEQIIQVTERLKVSTPHNFLKFCLYKQVPEKYSKFKVLHYKSTISSQTIILATNSKTFTDSSNLFFENIFNIQ